VARNPRTLLSALVLCLLLTGGVVAPAQPGFGARAVAARDNALVDLGSLDQLRDLFNQRVGVPRLILLLSPT